MAVTSILIGSAVVGAGASIYGSKVAGDAMTEGANAAAQATIRATELEVAEVRRQFDKQMELLAPLIAKQYGASSAFAQLLGFDGYNPETGEFAGGGPPTESGPQGFRDPNLNPIRLGADSARETEFGQQAFGNVLAGTPFEEDIARQHVMENRLSPAQSFEGDRRFQFAQDTAVVGEDFRTSPGYEFAVEQAQREVDRKNSAGGNYGGRALLEATRRIQGEADQEYYNWVRARHGDLSRQDAAISDFRRRQEMDVGRGDAALDNYLARRAGDISRQDQAVLNNQNLRQYDVQRQDQAYYNYLNTLAGASGIQGSVNQAVGASARAGAQAGGAYGSQGARLSGIYNALGENRANLAMGTAANVNNAIQGGMSNYLFADYMGMT